MLAGAAFIDITGVQFLTGALGIFFTGSIFAATRLTNPIIWFLAGHIIRGTGGNTFFKIITIVGTGVGRFLSFGTGSLGISLLTTAFFFIQIIIITISRPAGSPMPVIISIITAKLIA